MQTVHLYHKHSLDIIVINTQPQFRIRACDINITQLTNDN